MGATVPDEATVEVQERTSYKFEDEFSIRFTLTSTWDYTKHNDPEHTD